MKIIIFLLLFAFATPANAIDRGGTIPSEEVSQTYYSASSLTDISNANNIQSVDRASVKYSFGSGGVQVAEDTALFETIVISTPINQYIPGWTPTTVMPRLVDRNGCLWGVETNGQILYYKNPSDGGTAWTETIDFGAFIACTYFSANGYFFVVAGENVYRSTSADPTPSSLAFSLVISLDPGDDYYFASAFRDSFDSHGDNVWFACYAGADPGGGGRELAAGKAYESNDNGATWTQIFTLEDTGLLVGGDAVITDGYPYTGADRHLHFVAYNPNNDTLYISVGDTNPDIVWYKARSGSTWSALYDRQVRDTDGNPSFQPTTHVYHDGYLYLGPDKSFPGIARVDSANDIYRIYGPQRVEDYTLNGDHWRDVNSGTIWLTQKLSLINGAIVVPQYYDIDGADDTAQEMDLFLYAFLPEYPQQYVILDAILGVGDQYQRGWGMITGVANDGRFYASKKHNNVCTLVGYSAPTLSAVSALSSDKSVTNIVANPLFQDTSGWTDTKRTAQILTGDGIYNNKYCLSTTLSPYQTLTEQQVDRPVRVSFYYKKGPQDDYAAGGTIKSSGNPFIRLDYGGGDYDYGVVYNWTSLSEEWKRHSLWLDGPELVAASPILNLTRSTEGGAIVSGGQITACDATTMTVSGHDFSQDGLFGVRAGDVVYNLNIVKSAVITDVSQAASGILGVNAQICSAGGQNYAIYTGPIKIGGVMVQYSADSNPPYSTRLHESGSRDPDTISTTIFSPPAANQGVRLSGHAKLTYPVISGYNYGILDIYASDVEFNKLYISGRDVILSNNTGGIITLSNAIAEQIDYIDTGDDFYWVLNYSPSGSVSLSVSTQRSNAIGGFATAGFPPGVIRIYDGCTHVAGEELNGHVVERVVTKSTIGPGN